MARSEKNLSTPVRKKAKATKATKSAKSAKSAKPAKASKAADAVKRATSRVGKAIRSVTAKLRPGTKAKKREETVAAAPARRPATKKVAVKAARAPRRESDIPLDQIAETYTPPQTSLKEGFRGNGADRQRDQEMSRGITDDRWNDEDVFTNKSGDPRIGTHGRSYEPGEKRAATSRNRS